MYPGIAPQIRHRLKGMRAYLAGPMDRVADGGLIWRQKIKPQLAALGVVPMDPCDKTYYGVPETKGAREMLNELRHESEYDNVAVYMDDVAAVDLRMVDTSDFIILYVDIDVHMCGSYEEFARANQQDKPILCLIEQGKRQTPNWIFGRIPHQHLFSTMDSLIDHLKWVNMASNVSTYGRWRFPVFEKLYGGFLNV